jgi:hypothetical protein
MLMAFILSLNFCTTSALGPLPEDKTCLVLVVLVVLVVRAGEVPLTGELRRKSLFGLFCFGILDGPALLLMLSSSMSLTSDPAFETGIVRDDR